MRTRITLKRGLVELYEFRTSLEEVYFNHLRQVIEHYAAEERTSIMEPVGGKVHCYIAIQSTVDGYLALHVNKAVVDVRKDLNRVYALRAEEVTA